MSNPNWKGKRRGGAGSYNDELEQADLAMTLEEHRRDRASAPQVERREPRGPGGARRTTR